MPSYNNNPYSYNYPAMYQPNVNSPMTQPLNMPSYGYQPQTANYNLSNTAEPTWVQGMSGAMAFNMPRGSNPAMLMDSTTNRFYIKSVDPYTGRPLPLEVYEYKRIEDSIQNGGLSETNAPAVDMSQYVPKSDFDSMKSEVESLKAMIDDLTKPGK